jgi:hypothetical protein
VIALIPISYWLNPFAYYITRPDTTNTSYFFLLDPCDGVWMSSWGRTARKNQSVPRVKGLYFLRKNEAFPPAWYAPPHLQAGYLEVPLIWPSIGLMTLSIVIWKRNSHDGGGCMHCGYSLEELTTTTCPECGVDCE